MEEESLSPTEMLRRLEELQEKLSSIQEQPLWYVFVAELRKSVSKRSDIAQWNPKYSAGNPACHVGYLWDEEPEQRFPNGDFTAAGNLLLRKYGVGIISELTSRHSKKEDCLCMQERHIIDLRKDGWCVTNAEAETSHSVYVIELKSKVAEQSYVRGLNPDRNPMLPCVYVGQTSKTPEERLKVHLTGKHGSRFVTRRTVVDLRPDLYQHLNPLTELESLREERRLASDLRAQGWTVVGGH